MILYSLSFLKSSFVLCVKVYDTVSLARSFSNLNLKRESRERDHIYTNLCPWKSRRELAECLLESILLNDRGLIVLNKPYGVGIRPLPKLHEKDASDSRNTIIPNDNNYFLFDVLPYLGNALGVNKLIIAKSAEKYSSGITFLATSDSVVEKIQTCHKRDLCSTKITSKYVAVVLGKPTELSKKETVKIGLVMSPDGRSKQPIVQDSRTKPLKSKEIKTARVEYHTSATSEFGASLVEVKPSITKWHFLRVYLAHLLTPALGDNLYGSRVKTCLGVPISVNPFNDIRKSQKLNRSIVEALDLTPGREMFIPCHTHLQEVTLTSFNKDKSDLTVVAPLPEFFKWTCKKLDLTINT